MTSLKESKGVNFVDSDINSLDPSQDREKDIITETVSPKIIINDTKNNTTLKHFQSEKITARSSIDRVEQKKHKKKRNQSEFFSDQKLGSNPSIDTYDSNDSNSDIFENITYRMRRGKSRIKGFANEKYEKHIRQPNAIKDEQKRQLEFELTDLIGFGNDYSNNISNGLNTEQDTNSAKSNQLIEYLPRLSAYSEINYSLTSGFIPHTKINIISVKKTRTFTLRFKDSYEIELSHGNDNFFNWTIRRNWVELKELFECIQDHKSPSGLKGMVKKGEEKFQETKEQFHIMRSGDNHENYDQSGGGLFARKSRRKNTNNTNSEDQISIFQRVHSTAAPITEHSHSAPKEKFQPDDNQLLKNRKPAKTIGVPNRKKSFFSKSKKSKKDRSRFNIKIATFPSENDKKNGKIEDHFENKLSQWLEIVLNSREVRTLQKVQRFLGITRLSFIEDFGCKRSEIVTRKQSGGYMGGSKITFWLKNNWLVDKLFRRWSEKVFVVKDSFICYLSTNESELRGVMLFDNKFMAEPGNLSKNVVISNSQRTLEIRCKDFYEARQLLSSIEDILEDQQQDGYELISDKIPYKSFAPVRKDSLARPFICGRHYFHYLYHVLKNAKTEIFIADWFLSPECSLIRPDVTGEYKIKNILFEMASKGVKVSILLFDAPPSVLAHGLKTTEETMTNSDYSHNNIQLLRHGSGIEQKLLYAHHEKLVIIDQKVAFVGGIDICAGRYDDESYKLYDNRDQNSNSKLIFDGKDYQNPYLCDLSDGPWEIDEEKLSKRDIKAPRLPWHDIHSVVYGKAATDVARHFILRWNFTLQEQATNTKTTKNLVRNQRINLLLPISSCCKNLKFDEKDDIDYLRPPIENSSNTREDQAYQVDAQIVRSLSRWSGGITQTERSIQNAYLKMIEESKDFIYIENQFFITNSNQYSEMALPEVQNTIGNALCTRIYRAYKNKKKFKVYVVIPLMPCFQGDISKPSTDEALPIKAILHFQYASMNRQEAANVQSQKKSSRKEKQDFKRSGNSLYHCIYYHLQYLGMPAKEIQNYIHFGSLRKFEYFNKNGTNNSNNSSTEKEHFKMPGEEIIYVHSKLMIVDDRKCIIGSANINDRSQMGDRDSEVCVVYTDKDHTEKSFCKDLRINLWSRFLDIDPKKFYNSKNSSTDFQPNSDHFYNKIWKDTAKKNDRHFLALYQALPSDAVHSYKSLEVMLKNSDKKMSVEKQKENLKGIKGILVDHPLNFLKDENLHPANFVVSKEKIAPLELWT